jgi:hypothetical protein
MFCPNCGTQNDASPHYCRTCGLKLDAIATELTIQNPSKEVAALLKKKRSMELIGKSTLTISGIIGICLLLTIAVYYKLMLLGPEVLLGSAIGALSLFLLASIFFLAYPKFFFTNRTSRSAFGGGASGTKEPNDQASRSPAIRTCQRN